MPEREIENEKKSHYSQHRVFFGMLYFSTLIIKVSNVLCNNALPIAFLQRKHAENVNLWEQNLYVCICDQTSF